MVTDKVLVSIFLFGTIFTIPNLKSGTFDRKMSDFQITNTSVQAFLKLSEIECSAKCLSVDICQAAIVVKTADDEQLQMCDLLLYEEEYNQNNRNNLDLQDLDGISAIWFKNRVTEEGSETPMKDSQATTPRNLVNCGKKIRIHQSGCYLVPNLSMTWQEAENYCQTFGNNAHLARPDTAEKIRELESLTSLPIWIGANDTYGDNVIRYLGEGGATIPDVSPLWRLPLKHRFEGIDYDCVEQVHGDIRVFSLFPCHSEKNFVCEVYQ